MNIPRPEHPNLNLKEKIGLILTENGNLKLITEPVELNED